MKYQFSSAAVPPRAGWFLVHYNGRLDTCKRYFDGVEWKKGTYPEWRDEKAKGFTRNPNSSWSYWFEKD